MTTLAELTRLINESHLRDQTKQWALRRALTFKRESKVQEWTNKFRNINKERPAINSIRQLKRYVPIYVKVTINLFQTAHHSSRRTTRSITDPSQNRWSVQDQMYAQENDREVLLPKHFIEAYPKFTHEGMTFLGKAVRTFGDFKNVGDFIDAAKQVAPDESQDTLSSISWSSESNDVDGELQLVSVHAIPNARYNLRALTERPMRANDRRLAHPWLCYEADLLATSFEEMFTRPKYYYDGGCVYTAIMTYADEFNNRLGGRSNWNGFGRPPLEDITPESIHNACHPGKPFDPNNLIPISFEQLKLWLTKYSVCARLYHDYRLVEQFPANGECSHRDGRKRILCILMRDDHAHVFDESGIKQSVTKRLLNDDDEPDGICSAKYHVPSGDAQVFIGKISTVDEVFSVTQAHARVTKGKVNIRLLWNGNDASLLNAVESLIHKVDWIPRINDGKNGRTNSFALEWVNGKQHVHVCVVSPEYGAFGKSIELYELPLETINKTLELQHQLKMCNSRYLMSTYGEGVAMMFKAYRFAPPYASFGDCKPGEYDIIDMKRCYTTIVKSIKDFPKFGVHDVPKVYDGHALQDWTLYEFTFNGKRTHEMNIRFPANRGLLFGFQLKPYLKSVSIHTFTQPHQLVQNPFLDQLDIIEKSDLPDAIKKGIPLRNWGNWGKMHNSNRFTQLFTTLEDARATNLPDKTKEPLGRIVEHNNLFKLIVRNKTELIEGFLPLQHLLYTTARSKLADLVRDAGSDALGVHTDCVFLKSKPTQCPDHCRIGRAIMDCRKLEVKQVDYEVIPIKLESPMVHRFTELEEWTQGLADKVIEANMRVLFRAIFPGSGKSWTCMDYVKRLANGRSVLVACPGNDQTRCSEFGVTYHALCARGVDEVTKKDIRLAKPQLQADIVICEEVFQLSLAGKSMLLEYMDSHPDTLFIANGDIGQCDPVDTVGSWNPAVDQDAYHTTLINKMFPVQVELQVPKRWHDPSWVYALKADLDANILTQTQIVQKYAKLTNEWDNEATYFGYRRDAVNLANEMAHGDLPEYSIGQKLIYTHNTSCPKGGGKNAIHKGYVLRIAAIDDSEVTLIDDKTGLVHTLSRSVLKHFSYAYARTIHSAQGTSVDGKVILIDHDFFYVDRKWLWVALTRARNRNLIYRMDIKIETDKSVLNDRIRGYKTQDKNANRPIGDLDVAWWLETMKAQKNRCYLCDEAMSIKKPTRGGDALVSTADRIDSRFNHTKSNCKLCCKSCNERKKDSVLAG